FRAIAKIAITANVDTTALTFFLIMKHEGGADLHLDLLAAPFEDSKLIFGLRRIQYELYSDFRYLECVRLFVPKRGDKIQFEPTATQRCRKPAVIAGRANTKFSSLF